MKPLYALFALLLLTSCDVGTVFRRMLYDDVPHDFGAAYEEPEEATVIYSNDDYSDGGGDDEIDDWVSWALRKRPYKFGQQTAELDDDDLKPIPFIDQ